MKERMNALKEEIREHEGFIAFHWDTDAAVARLKELRAELARLECNVISITRKK